MSNPDFIKWFDNTYEFSFESEPIKSKNIYTAYRDYLIPFYKTKTKAELIANSKHSVFLKELQKYKYIYENHYKKWNNEFVNIRRKDGWYD